MIGGIVEAVIDALFEGTGRRLCDLFGAQPSHLAAMFTGMAFWAAAAIILLWALR